MAPLAELHAGRYEDGRALHVVMRRMTREAGEVRLRMSVVHVHFVTTAADLQDGGRRR